MRWIWLRIAKTTATHAFDGIFDGINGPNEEGKDPNPEKTRVFFAI
jgi:hypothetical protein